MICKNCGREIYDVGKLCPYCGTKLESEFVNCSDYYETENAGNDSNGAGRGEEYYNNAGGFADNGNEAGYRGEDYVLADIPEKKKRGKRPLWLSIICALLSFALSVVLFIFCVAIMFFISFNRSLDDSRSVFSSGTARTISEIPVGQVINSLDGSKDYGSDVTLSEYVYDKLPSADKANTSAEEIAEIIDNPAISAYVNGVLDDYMKVLSGEAESASISNDRILDVVRDNEELVESAIGREIKEEDYARIENKLDSLNLEEHTEISVSGSEEAGKAIEFVRDIINNRKAIVARMAVAIAVILILLVVLNLHKPYVVMRHMGVCMIFAAAIGKIISYAYDVVLKEAGAREQAAVGMVMNLLGSPMDNISSVAGIFLIVGIILVAVYVAAAILRKIISANM